MMRALLAAGLVVFTTVVVAAAWQPGVVARGVEEADVEPAVKAGGPMYSKSGYDVTPLDAARIGALAAKLSPEEAKIILRKGTEPAF